MRRDVHCLKKATQSDSDQTDAVGEDAHPHKRGELQSASHSRVPEMRPGALSYSCSESTVRCASHSLWTREEIGDERLCEPAPLVIVNQPEKRARV
eukprot:CAMPEP_0119377912 /NCGR_PEP_ID=MMETSP1334-20130426/47261_1 /TAXON_ID=127549 /ORGANISM="Calcidiscus leptoporus, Strain RCC1130" /LENGTH=95 /DNA_ID=CAMNT_0007396977 /DNA_START=270 /DNA_END=557 /DNA_ORIENTATION=+